jgi:outer membrane protein TolC
MKKFLYILITLALIISAFSAASAAGAEKGLTIGKAQIIAVENSRQADIDDLDIKLKETELKHIKEKPNPVRLTTELVTLLEYKLAEKVSPMQAELDLEVSKRIKQDNINSLRLDVYKTAMNILLAQKELDTENQKLAIAQEGYEAAKKSYELNLITENDLQTAKYNVDNKKFSVSEARERLVSASFNMRKLLNMPLSDAPIKLEDELVMAKPERVDINKAVQSAIEHDTTVYSKSGTLKIKQAALELTGEYFKEGEKKYDQCKIDADTAAIDVEDARANLEVEVRNKYNDLLNLQDKIELAEKYAVLLEKKLKISQVKYDNGVISKEEYLAEKEKYLDAEYQKYAAIHDYNIAKAEFEYLIGE